MDREYKLIDIMHSGRKGLRGNRVDDVKYRGLIGSVVSMDIAILCPYKEFTFYFRNHPVYEWWNTSPVLAAVEHDNIVEIETVNSIYMFKDLEADRERKETKTT